jgi:hypothetical protein
MYILDDGKGKAEISDIKPCVARLENCHSEYMNLDDGTIHVSKTGFD